MRKQSFAPVADGRTQVLVLGSLPGERSLAERRYYAHPQNRFWHLIGSVIDTDLVALEYEARLATLLAHGVGLWDTIASARRAGSLDTAIRDAAHAPLRELAKDLPKLRAVGFNGRTSQTTGMPQLAGLGIELVPLPSSSPAYAAMPLAEKTERWLALRRFLG